MRKIQSMWQVLKEHADTVVPYLRDDVELEAGLALLDFSIMPCIEEFVTHGGKLAPDTVVHLRNCKCELASMLRQSKGAVPCYFEDLLKLAREVLRRVKIKEALLVAQGEPECEMESFYDWPDDFFSVDIENCYHSSTEKEG